MSNAQASHMPDVENTRYWPALVGMIPSCIVANLEPLTLTPAGNGWRLLDAIDEKRDMSTEQALTRWGNAVKTSLVV